MTQHHEVTLREPHMETSAREKALEVAERVVDARGFTSHKDQTQALLDTAEKIRAFLETPTPDVESRTYAAHFSDRAAEELEAVTMTREEYEADRLTVDEPDLTNPLPPQNRGPWAGKSPSYAKGYNARVIEEMHPEERPDNADGHPVGTWAQLNRHHPHCEFTPRTFEETHGTPSNCTCDVPSEDGPDWVKVLSPDSNLDPYEAMDEEGRDFAAGYADRALEESQMAPEVIVIVDDEDELEPEVEVEVIPISTPSKAFGNAPDCHPNHNEVQHRDGKLPWCDECGWRWPKYDTGTGEVLPAAQLGNQVKED